MSKGADRRCVEFEMVLRPCRYQVSCWKVRCDNVSAFHRFELPLLASTRVPLSVRGRSRPPRHIVSCLLRHIAQPPSTSHNRVHSFLCMYQPPPPQAWPAHACPRPRTGVRLIQPLPHTPPTIGRKAAVTPPHKPHRDHQRQATI